MSHRSVRSLGLLVLVALLGAKDAPARVAPAAMEDNIAVFFSPDGGCAEAIIGQLNAAKKTIRIQAYFFTSPKIAKAVLEAQKRGVDVTAVIDKSAETANYSAADTLANGGVKTFIDHEHETQHSKVMLIDGQVIITGSFNFTAAADTSNVENLLIINNKPKLYAAYEKNFQEHLAHSKKYKGKGEK
jgi:phosphatidylserine/phosphatidylglycerophosphate/cardiolipin synthase-like enzyme